MLTPKKIIAAIAALLMAGLLAGCKPADAIKPDSKGTNTETSAQSTSVQRDGAYVVTVRRVVDGDTFTIEPSAQFEANYNCLDASGEQGTCREHAVRLLGVDAPEMNKVPLDKGAKQEKQPECGAQQATSKLASLLLKGDRGVSVKLRFDAKSDLRDKYGRSLAYAEIVKPSSGMTIDVGGELISTGHAAAWYPRSEPKPQRADAYEQAEQNARASRTGLHAQCESVGRS